MFGSEFILWKRLTRGREAYSWENKNAFQRTGVQRDWDEGDFTHRVDDDDFSTHVMYISFTGEGSRKKGQWALSWKPVQRFVFFCLLLRDNPDVVMEST